MKTGLVSRLLALGSLALFAGLSATPAKADPIYTYTIQSCNFVSGCPNPTVIAAFETASPIAGPPLPLPLPTPYYSESVVVPTLAVLAGSFTNVYMQTYNNIFNTSGAFIILDGLHAANGVDYGTTVGIDGFVDGPTTDPLVWVPGTYTGLIAFACNYGVACPSNSGAVDSVHVLVTETPEPESLALLILPLVGLFMLRRQGGPRLSLA